MVAEYVALMSFAAFFGREGGTPLQYIIAAAAPFVVFGLSASGWWWASWCWASSCTSSRGSPFRTADRS